MCHRARVRILVPDRGSNDRLRVVVAPIPTHEVPAGSPEAVLRQERFATERIELIERSFHRRSRRQIAQLHEPCLHAGPSNFKHNFRPHGPGLRPRAASCAQIDRPIRQHASSSQRPRCSHHRPWFQALTRSRGPRPGPTSITAIEGVGSCPPALGCARGEEVGVRGRGPHATSQPRGERTPQARRIRPPGGSRTPDGR
jgi:hypothetical protein